MTDTTDVCFICGHDAAHPDVTIDGKPVCFECHNRHEYDQALDKANARIAELVRMVENQDAINLREGMRVGLYFGCDTPEHMADEILELRAELDEVRNAKQS